MTAGQRTTDIIAGDQIFGRQVAFLIAIFAALAVPANSPATDQGSLAIRMLLSALAATASFGMLQVIRIAFLAWVKGTTRTTSTLIGIFISSALGGVLLQVMLTQLSYTDDSTARFRQIFGVIVFGCSLCLASYSVAVIETQLRRIDIMQLTQNDLERTLDERQSQHETIIDELLDKVDALINSEVSVLEGQSPRSFLSQLRRIATDVIRPISHELSGEIAHWTPRVPQTTRPQFSWAAVVKDISVSAAIRPTYIALATIALLVPDVTETPIFTFVGIFALALIVIPLSGELVRMLLARVSNEMPSPVVRIILMLICLALTVTPFGLITIALTNSWTWFVTSVFAAIYTGILVALADSINASSNVIDAEFTRINAALNWTQARLNLIQWYQRAEVARALHGPIQTAVSQVLPKISHAVGSGENTLGLVGELQRRIVASLGSLVNPRAEAIHLEHELTDLYETWQGSVEISFDVKRELLVALSTDPACATAFVEAVHEGCTNAVKHGGADKILIAVTEAPSVINLIISDNGRGIGVHPVQGLGTRLLDATCVRWYRRRVNDRTIVTSTFPYVPEHQAPTRRVLSR